MNTQIVEPEISTNSSCNRSNIYRDMNEEVIKRKFDNSFKRLGGGEEEDEEKTITTGSLPSRESIVGFFNESFSKAPSANQDEEN